MEKLVYGGEALGRVDGRVVMTPLALPGELVKVEPVNERPEIVRARMISVEEPSPQRVKPKCEVFGVCGGCHYQHAAYAYQLEQKSEILRETLRRVGKIDWTGEIAVVSGPEYGYRNRIQVHFTGRKLGFHGAGTNDVIGIESCPIASPRLNEAIAALRKMMRERRWPNFLRSLELFTDETKVQVNALDTGFHRLNRTFFQWCAETMPGAIDPALEYGGFRVSHKSFFQVNRFLVDKLVELALDGAAGKSALDLYAGVGLFSLELAKRFEKVVAVEAVGSAANDLDFNALRIKSPVKAVQAQSEAYLEHLADRPDFVLADPPRAGLGKKAVEPLLRLKPPRINLVSCDPSTLARDLAGLVTGGYRIEAITMIDLFPQTSHIESVVKLAL